MITSKKSRNVVAVLFLVLISFATEMRADILPRSKGDELLQILPAQSLFCVRLNNFNDTFGMVDQFLTGVSPTPMGVSMLVRMQFAKILGSPELNGVNMEGSFALFGVTRAEKPQGPKPSDIFIGALVPITDYKRFIDGNPNLSPPDANEVSKITSDGTPTLLVTQLGSYALFSSENYYDSLLWYKKLMGIGTSASAQSAPLDSVLDAAEVELAMKESLWIYGNIQQVSNTFGPLLSVQLEQMKQMMKGMESEKQMPMGPSLKAIEMYISILETLLKETKSLSLTIRPRPNVCNLTMNVSAVPGTEMANMFAADTSSGKKNRFLGYLEDGAMMNFAGNMNTPLWKTLNLKSIDLLTAIAGENMTTEDITKMKAMATDMISSLGGPVIFSFFIDANSKPPFALKYALEVKDSDKFNKILDEAVEMMNAGGIADFYKSLGIEMSFTIERGIDSYKGVSIDSAKLVMKSTDPNLPQGQIVDAMYGGGIEYRLAIVDGLFVSVIGGDVDSAIRKLIDEAKSGGPKQMSVEMKAALALLPEADTADFMGTYNFLRLFKMAGAMAGAFMPVPMPVAQMDIPTKSNIVFAGKAGNNRMTVHVALPKEHLIEIIAAVQMSMAKGRSLPKVMESAKNLSTIGKALLIYANDYEDQYPPNLQELVEKAELSPKYLESPLKPQDFDGPSYIYVDGQTSAMHPFNVLVYENPEFCSDKINVLFNDNHVEAMKPAKFVEKLQATYKQLGREMPEIKFKSPTKNEPLKMWQPRMQPQRTQESRVMITKANLRILHTAVLQFKMDTGRFPTEEEGLMALIEQPPDVKKFWEPGGYLNTPKIPKDGWGNDFIYDLFPESGKPFVIISLGADGEEGGEGYEADLYSTDR